MSVYPDAKILFDFTMFCMGPSLPVSQFPCLEDHMIARKWHNLQGVWDCLNVERWLHVMCTPNHRHRFLTTTQIFFFCEFWVQWYSNVWKMGENHLGYTNLWCSFPSYKAILGIRAKSPALQYPEHAAANRSVETSLRFLSIYLPKSSKLKALGTLCIPYKVQIKRLVLCLSCCLTAPHSCNPEPFPTHLPFLDFKDATGRMLIQMHHTTWGKGLVWK